MAFGDLLFKKELDISFHFHTSGLDNFRADLIYIQVGIYKVECSCLYLRKIENVRYQSQEKVIIILYNLDIVLTFFLAFGFCQQAGKADNRIQRSTDFVTHISQKN